MSWMSSLQATQRAEKSMFWETSWPTCPPILSSISASSTLMIRWSARWRRLIATSSRQTSTRGWWRRVTKRIEKLSSARISSQWVWKHLRTNWLMLIAKLRSYRDRWKKRPICLIRYTKKSRGKLRKLASRKSLSRLGSSRLTKTLNNCTGRSSLNSQSSRARCKSSRRIICSSRKW